MNNITDNEMHFMLGIFKSPELEYNANSISKLIGISSMGALKIAKRLEKENILISRELGKAKFFRLNLDREYVRDYVKFLLKREVEQANSYVKVWINEIRKLKSAYVAILFGSVLTKYKEAGDIDAVLITDKKKFAKLKEEVEEVNKINIKQLHPVYQSKADFIKNISKGDKVLLNAIKGIIVFGEDMILEVLRK
jgi:tRNA(Glu) U13 pseudouridine synthase TruD